MISRLWVFVFLLLMPVSFGQIGDTLYLNNKGEEASSRNYKKLFVKSESGDITRYMIYEKSGNLWRSGAIRTSDYTDTGPSYLYKNNKPIQIIVHEPTKYPQFLSRFDEYLQLIKIPSDTLQLVIWFHKNGLLKSIGYSGGCCDRHGTWLFFNKDGSMNVIENYQNDQLHGHYVSFMHGTSLKYAEGNYKDDNMNGVWQFYKIDGSLKKMVHYENGRILKVEKKPDRIRENVPEQLTSQ